MADFVFNIAKGRVNEKIADTAARVGFILLRTAEADDTLNNYATVATMLAAGGGTANVECNFTNYTRKLTQTGSIAVDNTANHASADVADQTWTAAGGALNNSIVKAILFYEESASPTDDTSKIPMTCHDYAVTTDGSDITLQVNSAGFYRAT